MNSYASLATRYDAMHRRWLRHAGGAAQSAFDAALAKALTPGAAWLDAGCGTGAMARRMLQDRTDLGPVTLLDACAEMLALAEDLPVRRIKASLTDLPFASGSFDVVTAAWSIEACAAPARAVRELTRVLRPGGTGLLVFCSDSPAGGLAARLLRGTVKLRGTGQFLPTLPIAALSEATGAQVEDLPAKGPATVLKMVYPNVELPFAA